MGAYFGACAQLALRQGSSPDKHRCEAITIGDYNAPMNRRDFLAKFSQTATVVGATTTAVAAGLHAKSRATVADGANQIRDRMKALEQRVDNMDASHRRLVRILAVTITVSTGFDIASLL